MGVLIFSGTTEGNELALALARAGLDVLVSCATETGTRSLPADEPHLETRFGAMDDDEMRALALASGLVVDATHPYARDISRHVREVCEAAGVERLRVVREPSDLEGCTLVDSVAEAAGQIAARGGDGAVLSTTGSKEVSCYTAVPGYRERLFARVLDDPASVEACRAIGLDDGHILAGRGPFSLEDNLRDIDAHGIAYLVTKDGGAAGGFPEKVQAARMRGVETIVVRRPAEEEGGVTLAEALWQIMKQQNDALPPSPYELY